MRVEPDRTWRVVYPEAHQVELEEEVLPPLGPRDLRVQTAITLISTGTELANLRGPCWAMPDGSAMPRFPHHPGYSHTGTVIAVGDEVTDWKVGDRVASAANHTGVATLGGGALKLRIPDEVGFEAATFTTLGTTVMNGVRLGQPQFGEVVAVVGLGLLGQLAAQYVRIAGADVVLGVDPDPVRRDQALRAGGVTHVVDPTAEDALAMTRDLSDGRGADLVFEVTGLTSTFDLCLSLARKHGRVVALGSPRWPAPVDMMALHMKAIKLLGAIVSSHPSDPNGENRWVREANAALVLRLLAQGKLQVQPLITHRIDACNAAQAFDLLVTKSEPALAVLLDWTDRGGH